MKMLVSPLLPAMALFIAALPATAQTPGPVVTEFLVERQVALSNALSSTSLALPADKLQGITSGAFELRERLIYNPAGATLTSTLFFVQAGSPIPTPLNANLTEFILGVYTLSIEKLYSTTKPANSLAFVGTVTSAPANGILGDVAGTPFIVSLGYSNDSPAKIIDLVEVIAGRIIMYSKSAVGVLSIPKPPPPPETGSSPQIVIITPTTTVDYQVVLDASKTTDGSGTSLTFAWKAIGKSSAILNPNTSMATVQFGEGQGEFVFEVTVTNGLGVSAKKTVAISYFGR